MSFDFLINRFLQQVLKLYAGKVLRLHDFVLLDSDIVWFRNVSFVKDPQVEYKNRTYLYATSNQYHGAYIACLKRIAGVDLLKHQKFHRSGIVHHMVVVESVLDDLMRDAQELHGGLPFWQIMLNQRYQCSVKRLPILCAQTLSLVPAYLLIFALLLLSDRVYNYCDPQCSGNDLPSPESGHMRGRQHAL
jgi:Family of unknown function (DUF6492)